MEQTRDQILLFGFFCLLFCFLLFAAFIKGDVIHVDDLNILQIPLEEAP